MSTFFFFLFLSLGHTHGGNEVDGSVACLDCPRPSSHLSGIQVVVKCKKATQMSTTYTKEDGSFTTEVPTNPSNCAMKIAGGPFKMFVKREDSIIAIGEGKVLKFYKECPLKGKLCGVNNGESKTVDIPLPREWGLAPSSYYFPFFPIIIGIP